MEGSRGDRSPGPTVQDVLGEDAIAPPEVLLREYPPPYSDNQEISVDRYLSQEWHDREVEHVWRKVCTLPLEEIQEVGDHIIYEVADESVIVVRTGSATHDITAYINSCLHRGTQFAPREKPSQVRCPFHGFTWICRAILFTYRTAGTSQILCLKIFVYLQHCILGVSFSSTLMTTTAFDSYIEVLDEEFQDFPRSTMEGCSCRKGYAV